MMNRAFTQREKILLLILTVMLLVLAYFKGFYQPLEERSEAAQLAQSNALDELTFEQTKNQRMNAMQKELDDLKAQGVLEDAVVPNYDNVENVMVQLNSILSAAVDYQLTFSDVQDTGDGLMSRPVQMTFTAVNYAQARKILDDLYHCYYRCALSDLSIAGQNDIANDTQVSVSVTATFLEKIVK